MYGGGMVKLGRGGGGGGGRGGGKRSLPPPPPPSHIQRVGGPSPAAAARLPLGSSSSSSSAASRGRHGAGTGGPGVGVTAAAPEETFRMVSADNLDFAAIIRLSPDLVDEIRRLEAQGGAAKIKFDSNSNNLSGNVIDVGGKEFKFTWSRELGVCDIYKEVQNGEDGNGLLSECGSAWRKLNVQRILDESLKNQVKMRSEEAERKLKSRRSIVLDPANPSVKSQAKTMAAAAVEGNMRRTHWKKDQLFKKRKSEPSMVPNPVTHKSAFKSGMSTISISPQPSPPEQAGIGPSGSPFGMTNHTRGHATMDEDGPPTSNGVDDTNSAKELANKPFPGTIRRPLGNKGASCSEPVDLRSLLINLLSDNPKGMSLKALEKAVVEAMPNSGKKIETIIKTIATYQAPGRYILKPGVDVESSRKPPSESGSSPEHPLGSMPVKEVMEKDNAKNEDLEHKPHLISKPVEPDNIENIDIEQNSPDRSTVARKVNNEYEEGACSSSESGSDSDSESDSSDSGSDSGSQSRSRSKSQSPIGSGSASSSDSESDGSSSSKEGSDVDVDIMTSEDDKEETGNKLPRSSRLSPPTEGKPYNEGHQENVIGRGNLDSQRASSPIDSHDYVQGNAHALENASNEAKMKTHEMFESATPKSIVSDELQMNGQVFSEGMTSQDQYQQPVLQSMSLARNSTMDKSERVGDHIFTNKQFIGKKCPDPKQFDGRETMSKPKFKRVSDSKDLQGKPESNKRSRAADKFAQTTPGKNRDNNFAEKSCIKSPGRSETGQYGGQIMLSTKDVDQDRNTFNSLKEGDAGLAGRHMVHENEDGLRLIPDFHNANLAASDARQLHERAGDAILSGKASDGAERSGRHIDNFSRAVKHPEKSYGRSDESDPSGTRNMNSQDKFSVSRDRMHKDIRDVVSDINEKYSAQNILDDTGGDKPPPFPDTRYRRYGDQNGIQKDTKLSLNMHKADVEKFAVNTEKGFPLRRELSDLELGEFREPSLVEDTKGGRRQFERKGSFKSSDSKVNVMDNFSSDSNKGRTPVKLAHESKRESPYVSKYGSQANQDGSYRRLSEGDVMESTVPQQRTNSSQVQQFRRTDRPEHDSVSHLDRLPDLAGRNETRTSQGIDQENCVASHKRASDSVLTQRDTKHNGHMAGRTTMDNQPAKSNGPRDTSDQSKESFPVESVASGVKRMESSSDEDDSVYAKYDKDKPELRGPIKDYSQYKEYALEFCEKYDCYLSLNRHLEKYRNEFTKVGRDLETSRGRDKEAFQNISEQIVQMYLQCKKKHSRMRRIFVMLHDELKVLKQRIKDFVEEYTRD